MIEQVIIKKTLKAGKKTWEEGAIINAPIPQVLIEEVEMGTGIVEVVKRNDNKSGEKLIFVAQKVENTSPTNTTVKTTPPKINKLKPVLKRRK
jgi:hypothetical protein